MTNPVTRPSRALFGFLLLAACANSAALATSLPEGQMRQTFRANLGAQSGHYTDWEMKDIEGFHSVTAKVDIGDSDGKPKDKWAALARLALVSAGEGAERKLFSLLMIVDRKNGKRSFSTECGDVRTGLDVEVPRKEAFDVEISRISEEQVRVTVNDMYYDFDCSFDVVGVRALGSGLDVQFDPLTVTSAVPGTSR